MTYKIISPTGVSVIKTLFDNEVEKLKREKYFTLELQTNSLDDFFDSVKPVVRIHRAPIEECLACQS